MESVTPRVLLTWAIIAAIVLLLLRWAGTFLVLILGAFVALLILDGLYGGTAWLQVVDGLARLVQAFIEWVAKWINSGGLAFLGI